MKTDVLVVGSGCSGLYCALNLPGDRKITVVTKSDAESAIPIWPRAASVC